MTNPDRAFQKHAHLFGSATYASPTTAWSVSRFGDRSVVFSGVNSLLVLVFLNDAPAGDLLVAVTPRANFCNFLTPLPVPSRRPSVSFGGFGFKEAGCPGNRTAGAKRARGGLPGGAWWTFRQKTPARGDRA